MGFNHITAGLDIPNEVNVIIEIPAHSLPVKYEIDKKTETVQVDRFIETSMVYPCNYGFIPQTLSEDGDPLDVIVITPYPLLTGCLIRCRPVGLLSMTDEHGKDDKILTVPIDKITALYQHIHRPEDVDENLLNAIVHFFKHYKDLEPGKWVTINGWENLEAAKREITASVERFKFKSKRI